MDNTGTRNDQQTNPRETASDGNEQAVELPVEVSVEEAARLIQSESPPIVLDVREDCERNICKLEGGLHIPIGNMRSGWETLPRDQRILVICHHGVRSLHVTHFLRDKGLDQAQSIMGGIAAWSLSIDPKMPRY